MEMAQHMSLPRPHLQELPVELLRLIWCQLDSPCPSLVKIHDQPSYEVVSSTTKDLKSASQVSRRLRSSVLPFLFRYACVRVDSSFDLSGDLDAITKGFLDFVRGQTSIEMDTLTFLVETKESQNYSPESIPQNDFASFWAKLFSIADPQRLTIIAPPAVLAALCSADMITSYTTDYHMPYQALSLRHSVRGTRSGPQQDKTDHKGLLHLRPWEEILLNEGSFIRSYSQPGYPSIPLFPPSILPYLASASPLNSPSSASSESPSPASAGQDETSLNLPPTIRCFSYIAIFPHSHHLHHLARFFPQLHTVFFQLCPRGDPLPDPWQTAGVDFLSISIERERAYRILLEEIHTKSAVEDDNVRQCALGRVDCGDAKIDSVWRDELEIQQTSTLRWKAIGENKETLVMER